MSVFYLLRFRRHQLLEGGQVHEMVQVFIRQLIDNQFLTFFVVRLTKNRRRSTRKVLQQTPLKKINEKNLCEQRAFLCGPIFGVW